MKWLGLIVAVMFCCTGQAWADSFGTGASVFDIEFVTISGSTNPTVEQASEGDLVGFGIVHRDYRIGMYEITNDQWNKFEGTIH